MNKPKKVKWPSVSKEAELIMKLTYMIDATTPHEYPVLTVGLVGNAAGYDYLSRLFRYIAETARRTDSDVDNHIHIGRREAPFNKHLSDDFEIRLDTLSCRGRATSLRRLGISRSARRKGSMIPHLRRLTVEAEKTIRREAQAMKRFRALRKKEKIRSLSGRRKTGRD